MSCEEWTISCCRISPLRAAPWVHQAFVPGVLGQTQLSIPEMMDVFDLSELCHGDRRVGWQPAPTGAESRHSAGIHMSQPPWREESGGEGPWRAPQGGSRRCGALDQELGWSASSWGWPSTKGAAYSGKCGLHQPWASEDLALSPADPG